MAEEKNDMQLSPEITKLDKTKPRRNSTGIVKRNSTAKCSSQNYLRASTGSCHDFCKYGREQTFAVQARNPKPKRMTPPSKKKGTEHEIVAQKSKPSASKLKPSNIKVQSSKQNLGNAVQGERKKTSKVKLKPSSVDIAHSPEPPEITKREILLPSKQLDVSLKQNSSDAKIKIDIMKKTSSSKYSSGPKSKPLMIKPSPALTTLVGINGTRNTFSKPGNVIRTSKTAVKKLPSGPGASLYPKTSNSRAVNLYSRKHSSVNLVSPLKDQQRTQNVKSKPDTMKVQEKALHAVEADIHDKVIEPVQGDSTVHLSSSPSLQSPSISLTDSQFSASHEDVAEESKYIDKDIQQSECTDSEDLELSEYTESEVDGFSSEDDDEFININDFNKLKSDNNQCLKVEKMMRSGNRDGAMARSKFRKGRTVDLQIVHNVPRKLKFRRGRILGDNDDKHAARRSFEKRKLDDDSNGGSPSSEQVVLRHQDMQGKKDAQVLYNNVIEETASKLVESRKSKVKALVGAFETVISLQESKPCIPTVT